MNKHKQVHDKLAKLQCPACRQTFKYYDTLKHVLKHDGITYPKAEEYKYQCSFISDDGVKCQLKFASRDKLSFHEAKHTGDRPIYECELCFQKLSCLFNKNKHMQGHIERGEF